MTNTDYTAQAVQALQGIKAKGVLADMVQAPCVEPSKWFIAKTLKAKL